MILPLVIIGISYNSVSDPTFLYLAEHKQLMEDWNTRPYVDITVVKSDEGCPIDYEPLFYRNWNGTHEICIDYAYIAEPIIRLHTEDRDCPGKIIPEMPPINMTSITGFTACAKRGGPTFLETVRVDPRTRVCPRGYVPCSTNTDRSDTVCVRDYEKEHECPIIDIVVIHENNIALYKSSGY